MAPRLPSLSGVRMLRQEQLMFLDLIGENYVKQAIFSYDGCFFNGITKRSCADNNFGPFRGLWLQ